MTARDWVWLAATVLFVAGVLGIGWSMWLARCDERARRARADQLAADLAGAYSMTPDEAGRAIVGSVYAAKGYRIIDRPPYDWSTDGD